ncbi:MAG: hypothetical protein M1541_02245 [Acidobacteria bacterium]|nr:hypothetical protein [Acidobacteriota bacterium]
MLVGENRVELTYGTQSSAPALVKMVAAAPGVFEAVTDGTRHALAIRPNGSAVAPNNPARRGEHIRVYLTGVGGYAPSTPAGAIGRGESVTVQAVVGLQNAGVPIVKVERAKNLVGIDLVTILIPLDAPTGTAVPLSAGITADGGTAFSNTTSLPIY